jgi:thiol peroxidase
MAFIDFGGSQVQTSGSLPDVGSVAPDALLVAQDLASVQLHAIAGTRILNIFPSIGTGVCQTSVREFSARAGALDGVTVLHISQDLPFAHKGFCAAEGLEGVMTLSTFRGSFGADYGVSYLESPFQGLLSRCVLVLDAEHRILHTEQVPITGQEPDYAAALAAVGAE